MQLSRPTHGLLLTAFLATVGCSGTNELQMVPVSGVVTFDGQPCPAKGKVGFVPLEAAEGLPRRQGSGTFDTDGQYEVASFKPGDGLIPGRYSVRVLCLSGPILDNMGDQAIRALSYVAEGYEPPEIVVEKGSDPIVMDLDLPLRK